MIAFRVGKAAINASIAKFLLVPAEEEFISMTDRSTLDCLRSDVIGRKIRRTCTPLPSVPDANAQPIRHADDTHVEDDTEQPLIRVDRGKGLDNSPLSKLPAELRAKIFEMALVYPTGIHLRAGDLVNVISRHELQTGYLLFDPAGSRGSLITKSTLR